MFILLIYFKLRIILNNADVSFKFLGTTETISYLSVSGS